MGRTDGMFVGDGQWASPDNLSASLQPQGRFVAPLPGDAGLQRPLEEWGWPNPGEDLLPRRAATGTQGWSRGVQRPYALVDAAGKPSPGALPLVYNPRWHAETQTRLGRRRQKTQAFWAALPQRLGKRALQSRAAIEKATVVGGSCSLSTHDPALTTPRALDIDQEQDHPEQRCTWLQGAGLLAPVSLTQPHRSEAFCCVVGVVLLRLTLVEPEGARRIAASGKPLLGLQPNRLPDYRPKTEALLHAFRHLTVTPGVLAEPPPAMVISPLTALQTRLLPLLGLEEASDTWDSLTRPLDDLASSEFPVRHADKRNMGYTVV